jgi:protocatechuate 3,4-dioxygenase beta subunit
MNELMSQMNRRNLFKVATATGIALASGKLLAQACLDKTGIQPLGPFFPHDRTPFDLTIDDWDGNHLQISEQNNNDLTKVNGRNGIALGQQILISGVVSDHQCRPIANAKVIIWQASQTGRYNHLADRANIDFIHTKTGEIIRRFHDENFQYWGLDITNERGEYQFKTIIPGFYPADLRQGWFRPPHIHYKIITPNKKEFVTQAYFEGEIEDNDFIQELNEKDFLLQNPNLSHKQREELIIKVKKQTNTINLKGEFNITV